ncbi:unnamed protein product [Ectocarpus sp. 6 AP-2014]
MVRLTMRFFWELPTLLQTAWVGPLSRRLVHSVLQYAFCEKGKDKSSAQHEISGCLLKTDSREKLTDSLVDDAVGNPVPVKLAVVRRIRQSNPGVAIYVNPSVSVICPGTCDESPWSDQPLLQGSEAGELSGREVDMAPNV